MNWRAEATEKLRKYDAMCRAAQNIPEELKRLEMEACALRGKPADATAVRGGGTREEALINNLLRRQELETALEHAKLWVSATQRALTALTEEERMILQQMVISPQRGGVAQLCEKLCCEHSSVYRKRDRALEKFTIALYGITLI